MSAPAVPDRTGRGRNATAPPARPARLRRPQRAALVLLASITVTSLAGASAPTPLYAHYQAQWGFTPLSTTVVFGAYAVSVLLALLVFGELSDHVGRRPVFAAALTAQAAALLVFATAGSVPALLTGRVLQRRQPGRSAPACWTSTGPAGPWPTRSAPAPARHWA